MQEPYEGEERRCVEGHWTMAYYQRGSADRPLAVFIPGGTHLARISYGIPSLPRDDFLAYWLGKAGYPFLGLSYPLKHPLFGDPDPAFTVAEWAREVGVLTRLYAERHGHSEVVVIAWSMAGRLIGRIKAAMEPLSIRCFVPMLGAPFALGETDRYAVSIDAKETLFRAAFLIDAMMPHLRERCEIEGRELFDRETYQREFLGDHAINLVGTSRRFVEGALRTDVAGEVEDLQLLNYAQFPPLLPIVSNGLLDDSRITQPTKWAQGLISWLYATRIEKALVRLRPLEEKRWHALTSFCDAVPGRLVRYVEGSHLAFLGRTGAQQMVTVIEEGIKEVAAVQDELDALLSP